MMISCIIPSFNGLHLLKKHLPRVLATLPNESQLIISDDASTDDSINWLKNEFKLKDIEKISFQQVGKIFPDPDKQKLTFLAGHVSSGSRNIEIIVIHNQLNMRFAAAANLGILAASGDYILLLNNDVSPAKSAVKQLIKTIETDADIFAVSAIEYESEKQTKASGKNKLWFDKGLFQHSKADNMLSGETAWASGGSALVNKRMFFELGGFDHNFYPAYWEDIDLCFRARKLGYRILFEANAVVYHHHESTHQDVWQQQELMKISWRNADKFTWKNGDFWQKLAFILWRPYWWWLRAKDPASQDI